MVDPFTGDFSYNIPLMDVEGYPINIAYNSGVTMDQEASWVGLGWNLNMGAIVRSMRGLPDDFDGDLVTKYQTQKPRVEFGVNASSNFEIFGKNTDEGDTNHVVDFPSMHAGVNFTYSNYTGYGVGLDFGPSFSLGQINKVGNLSGNLSFSGSSENGAGFSGGVSLSSKVECDKLNEEKMTNSIGGGFNSRSGLTYLSYSNTINGKAENAMFKNKNSSFSTLGSSYSGGLHFYSPSPSPNFISHSITGRFSWTTSILASDVQWTGGLFYSAQKISNIQQINPAFGYFNLHNGAPNDRALLDFNRDNETSFSKYTPNLPSAYLTNDIFNIQAQGIAGSYRAYRNEIGFVFDPLSESHNSSGNIGIELGVVPNLIDLGVDLTGSVVNSHSGSWSGGTNQISNILSYEVPTDLQEANAFQEANEKSVDVDDLFGSQFTRTSAEHFYLDGIDVRPKLTTGTEHATVSINNRDNRIKRNQLLTFLSIADVKAGLGLFEYRSDIYSGVADHHIGEMTQLGTDGRRYVFGIPAYNHSQEDATFSTGDDLGGHGGAFPSDDYNGMLVFANNSDFDKAASLGNDRGIDEYYSSTTTPAYAHSFMLSAVLSDDYVDSDGEQGPTDNDLGSYVKFDYQKIDNVRWRSPMGKNTVYSNPGLKTDKTDDKASFLYGEKEVWYVKAVETKNYIAILEIADRNDGISVNDRSGGLNPGLGKMKCLKKISLYAKPDYEANGMDAVPIQEVHFVYDYSLCQGYPGNINGGGKLTLKEIYFTYQGSYKLKRSSYRFEYNSPNADYNMKAVDRWGNYQATGSGTVDFFDEDSKLTSSDFPYTLQDTAVVNSNCQQWTLTDIFLPSGGKIHVDYESDDYAYVQHLRASQMYPIVMTGDENGDMNSGSTTAPILQPLSPKGEDNQNRAIFFKLKPGFNKQEDYFLPNQAVYFKCLVNMGDKDSDTLLEYVSGYAYVNDFEVIGDYGRVTLKAVKLLDDGSEEYNPITKAAILFGRTNMPRTIYDVADVGDPGTNENSFKSFINAVVNAGSTYKEYFTGPNKAVYDHEKCQELVTQRSFIRLLEPTKHKLGGGLRVKSIKMYDNWAKMINSADPDPENDFSYGQEFNYEMEDGSSSGVASYEPMAGGDENSWKTALAYDEKFMFAPDNELFLSNPIMESQFPNPSVGYSRVIITDLKRDGVTRTATGKVVKEFYTAKDFPTLTDRTLISKGNNSNSMKIETSFLPLLPKYDYLTASQGFKIETNDMHGKPKSEAVYAEGQTTPLSTVRYDYLSTPIVNQGVPCFKLKNDVQVVDKFGNISTAEVGVKYDAVADFRESVTNSIGVGPIEINSNSFLTGPLLLVIPTVWAKVDISKSQFRSATLNKTVNRFGIVSKIEANQDGSKVETANLAYDAETGDVIATQTTTDFNDKVYSLNFPAHWKYDRLGQAYQNINYQVNGYPVFADGFMPMFGAYNYFVAGDELRVVNNSTEDTLRAWVTDADNSGVHMIDKSGQPVSMSSASVKVIRSGRRNKQSSSMASITALENPLTGLTTEIYPKVLNAGAIEFSENWRTYCDCFSGRGKGDEEDTISEGEGGGDHSHDLYPSINPYITGTKGNWRPVRSLTYLTERTQTHFNNNTDIRRDGVFSSFSPYYYIRYGDWRIDPSNWTFVSKVTEFSPNGMTLETQDALGRFSSSLFGFNNTLTTAVTANAQLRQIAEGSFEDLDYSNCMDQGVFSKSYQDDISRDESHTGRSSIHVFAGESRSYGAKELGCDSYNDCSIELIALSDTTYSVSGTIDGFTPNVISGSGSLSFDDGVLTVDYTPGSYFEAQAIFVDKTAGCQVTIRINTVLPDNLQLSMQVLSTGQN